MKNSQPRFTLLKNAPNVSIAVVIALLVTLGVGAILLASQIMQSGETAASEVHLRLDSTEALQSELTQAAETAHDLLMENQVQLRVRFEEEAPRVTEAFERALSTHPSVEQEQLRLARAEWKQFAKTTLASPNVAGPSNAEQWNAVREHLDRSLLIVQSIHRLDHESMTRQQTSSHRTGQQITFTFGAVLGVILAAGAFSLMRIMRTQAKWKERSVRDPLTDLYNRREFDAVLRARIDCARGRNEPLVLLMLDLDRFKTVNDTYGHPLGDRVLQAVAHQILQAVRSTDSVFRTGGEEFAVVLPNTTSLEAVDIGDRIRMNVSTADIQVAGNRTLHVTISVGVAAFPGDADSVEDLFAAADRALYAAKQAGRNHTWLVNSVP
ncbi:MAG TPA: GGDEF domain-containing protein [Symbiobacteriaceae bacterium]|jgi:diguanylate cyclase (GGDEF)-like protein